MPRLDGDVFRLGTAMSISSRGVGQGIVALRPASAKGEPARMPIKAALIEEGIV
jgi:hypothetical protein